MCYKIIQIENLSAAISWVNHYPGDARDIKHRHFMDSAYGFDLNRLVNHITGNIKGRELSNGKRHVVFTLVGVETVPISISLAALTEVGSCFENLWEIKRVFSIIDAAILVA